ncbi:MAG: inorganic phosphate transporter [Actinomycetes bacterium]
MDLLLIAVVAIIALALLFDFTNGFHDAANSVATVVATRAMSPRIAVAFSAFFNFLAYFFVGTAVANTISKVVDADFAGVAVVFAALIGAISWNYLTWWLGMPSSSSHALLGGLVGAGLAAGWLDAIAWTKVEEAALAIFVSPLVAFTIAFVAMYLVAGLQSLTGWADNARPFKSLQILSAAAVSFGHGANDAQKTMGVIAALLAGAGYTSVDAGGTIPVPEWVALSAYAAIALGTLWGGWKIIETMGLRITSLHASSGLAANIGAVTSIFGATSMGIPISTTQAAGSSVMGAGVASGKGLNLKVVGEMLLAWAVTIPSTTAFAFLVYKLTQLPLPAAWLAVTALLFVLGGAIVYAMAHATRAEDIAAEIPDEESLAEHVVPLPRLEGHDEVA